MNINTLKILVQRSVNKQPLPGILEYCTKQYYSPYYHLAYRLSKYFNDGVYIELGCEKGRFLNSLALGSKRAKIIGIDSVIRPELMKLEKYQNVFMFHNPSLPPPTEFSNVNILHIDTEHSEAMAKSEFEAYKGFLNDGAIVMFDDLHAKDDEVKRYFESLDYKKIESDKLHSCGYGVLIYET